MSPRRRSRRRSGRSINPRPAENTQAERTSDTVKSTQRTVNKPVLKSGGPTKLLLAVPVWQFGILALLTILIFSLYLKTAARTVPTGDSGELIAAAWNLGIAHPPGYPTNTILSHIAGLFPIGTPAFRMNILSAIFNAIAVGLLGLGILRYFQARSDPSQTDSRQLIPIIGVVIGTGMLAISTAFWSYSLVAEVFALNNLFAAIVFVLMLEWVRKPERYWFLRMSFLFTGLALTNQMTFILLVPGLVFMLVWGLLGWRKKVITSVPAKSSRVEPSAPGWKFRELGIGIGFFIIGLLPYIYLPIAASSDPLVNWGDPSTFSSFWSVITRANYGTFSFTAESIQGDRLQQLVVFGRYLVSSFTVFGVILAVAGVAWFIRRKRGEAIGIGLAFLFSGPFFALFANPQLDDQLTRGVFERFYILPSILFAVFISAGSFYLMEGAARIFTRAKRELLVNTVILSGMLVAVSVPAGIAIARIPALDMSNDRVAEYYGEDLLATLEPDSVLLMRSDENYTSVVYLQTVLGFRTDVAAFDVELLKLNSYVEQQRRLYPEVAIPFAAYDEGYSSSLVDFINSNIQQRAVFGVGMFKEDLTESFDEVFAGLAYQIVPKGEGTDSYEMLRSESDRFANLHFPEKTYPPISWQALIAQHYGFLAHNLAYARQKPEAQPDADFVERMYRIAIFNDPGDAASYKNLGLLLWKNGGAPDEITRVFEKYLEMVPDDPEKMNILSVIKALENK